MTWWVYTTLLSNLSISTVHSLETKQLRGIIPSQVRVSLWLLNAITGGTYHNKSFFKSKVQKRVQSQSKRKKWWWQNRPITFTCPLTHRARARDLYYINPCWDGRLAVSFPSVIRHPPLYITSYIRHLPLYTLYEIIMKLLIQININLIHKNHPFFLNRTMKLAPTSTPPGTTASDTASTTDDLVANAQS